MAATATGDSNEWDGEATVIQDAVPTSVSIRNTAFFPPSTTYTTPAESIAVATGLTTLSRVFWVRGNPIMNAAIFFSGVVSVISRTKFDSPMMVPTCAIFASFGGGGKTTELAGIASSNCLGGDAQPTNTKMLRKNNERWMLLDKD